MSAMKVAYREMWQRWSDFGGRSSIGKFWWTSLVNVAILILFIAVAMLMLIGTIVVAEMSGRGVGSDLGAALGALTANAYLLFLLVSAVPLLAVTVRRLHDANRSGWWILISVIPLVGLIILIFFLATPGDQGPNRFGLPEISGSVRP